MRHFFFTNMFVKIVCQAKKKKVKQIKTGERKDEIRNYQKGKLNSDRKLTFTIT